MRLYWSFPFDAVDEDFQKSGCVSRVIEIGVSIHLAVDDAALERCVAGIVLLALYLSLPRRRLDEY